MVKNKIGLQGFRYPLNSVLHFLIESTGKYEVIQIEDLKVISKDIMSTEVMILNIDNKSLNPVMQFIREVKEMDSMDIKIICVCNGISPQILKQVIYFGIDSCFSMKEEEIVEVISAIDTVLDGKVYIGDDLAKVLFTSLRKKSRIPLTAREFEILRLAAYGYSNSQVSEKLFISNETVRAHLRNIYKKLNVKNRCAAIHRALTENWIPPDTIERYNPFFAETSIN